VQQDQSARNAWVHALTVLRREPYAVLFGSYPSAAGSVLAVLGATWALARIDLSLPSHVGAILSAFAVQQLAVLFSIAWRVRWLRRALELSAS